MLVDHDNGKRITYIRIKEIYYNKSTDTGKV